MRTADTAAQQQQINKESVILIFLPLTAGGGGFLLDRRHFFRRWLFSPAVQPPLASLVVQAVQLFLEHFVLVKHAIVPAFVLSYDAIGSLSDSRGDGRGAVAVRAVRKAAVGELARVGDPVERTVRQRLLRRTQERLHLGHTSNLKNVRHQLKLGHIDFRLSLRLD